jgi:hypothetical protein
MGRERLQFFVDHGMLEAVPTRWQLAMGSLAMMPYALNETENERETSRRTLLGQVPVRVPLQVIYCPRQAIPGAGMSATKDTIVRHLISAYHDVRVLTYDLQMLQAISGLDHLERRALDVVHGRDRWAPLLTRMCGGAEYHARLAELAPRAARFDYPKEQADPRFSSLVGFARFCLTFPRWRA